MVEYLYFNRFFTELLNYPLTNKIGGPNEKAVINPWIIFNGFGSCF